MLPHPETRPKKSIFRDHPWFMFLFGLVLGIALFSTYHYFQSTGKEEEAPIETEQTRPAEFTISENDHIWGSPLASVELVVFNDFTCPYSRSYMSYLADFMNDYKDNVKIIWRHFILNKNNQESLLAANAAECAGEQGKFWEFVHQLHQEQDSLSLNFYDAVAKDLGLDQSQFQQCAEMNKYQNKIEADYAEGLVKNVRGTPATFINGRLFEGVIPPYDLGQLIKPLAE